MLMRGTCLVKGRSIMPLRGTYPVKGRNTTPMRGTCHGMLMTGTCLVKGRSIMLRGVQKKWLTSTKSQSKPDPYLTNPAQILKTKTGPYYVKNLKPDLNRFKPGFFSKFWKRTCLSIHWNAILTSQFSLLIETRFSFFSETPFTE